MRRIFLLLVLLALGLTAFLFFSRYGPSSDRFVDIAPGTSSRQIARQLQDSRIIRSRFVFEALQLIRGGTLKAGEYRFDHPAKPAEVYDRIERGDVFTIALTIPEGSNIFDIAQRVEAVQLGSAQAFLSAEKKNRALIAGLDPQAETLEGYLFPDTYHFDRHATPELMLAAMVKRFRTAAASLGLESNVHRVVTLASLIERETPIDAERPLVASVFDNRLAAGMPLMTDPAIIYAAMLDGRYRGAIYQSDLNAESPYNTYKHVGLPPGPICNPGMNSLSAAMHPAKTNYLYFVAASSDPSGHSRFSATLEEHEKNVESYRRALRGGH